MQREPGEALALLVQRRQRVRVQGHQVAPGDEHLHLQQRRPVIRAVLQRAVEDQEDVVAVVIELGALTEVQRVLQGHGVKAEELVQLLDVLLAGRGDVQPEEVVAREVVADLRLIDLAHAWHHEAESRRGRLLGRVRLRLSDSHRLPPRLKLRPSAPARAHRERPAPSLGSIAHGVTDQAMPASRRPDHSVPRGSHDPVRRRPTGS